MPENRFYSALKGAALALLFGVLSGTGALAEEASSAAHPAPAQATPAPAAPAPAASVPVVKRDSNSTADHSKFKELQGPFANGSEVTKVCLSCHNEAGHQFMKSIHWNWEYIHPKTGQKLGKRHLVNNFCTNARGNEGTCATCHASYNWTEQNFDFTKQENIDCLVCHDGTGKYYKLPPTKGNAACASMFEGKPSLDLTAVAQNVALPSRTNCGACHFNGGGGDGVKHGDLDSSLKNPPRTLDVHMDASGLNFACTECHRSKKHIVAGSRYDVIAKDEGGTGKPGLRRDVATCESCHSESPHSKTKLLGLKLNSHVAKVACQTCHIPALSRGGVATVVYWDWRTAGALDKNNLGFSEDNYTQGNGKHRHTYRSIKGNFTYGETWPEKGRKLLPHYAWFDGQMRYTTIDTKFDPAKQPISINSFSGSYNDPKSRIWPFKRMHTTQPYDKGNNTLVYMHLWGDDKDAFWGNYDFDRAIRVGMAKNNMPYSGEYGFIESYSHWPITHMVAPKSDALKCGECHARNGRLAGLTGFYMPGRDNFPLLDLAGYTLLAGAFGGVILHALLRGATRRFRKGHAHD